MYRAITKVPRRLHPVFELLVSGRTEKQIASAIHKSVSSVHSQIRRIYRTFSVESRAQLLALVLAEETSKQLRLDASLSRADGANSLNTLRQLRNDIEQMKEHSERIVAVTSTAAERLAILITVMDDCVGGSSNENADRKAA